MWVNNANYFRVGLANLIKSNKKVNYKKKSLHCSPCLACWAFFHSSLVPARVTTHPAPKCMTCHKAIVVITKKELFSWLHMYYIHFASVRFEHSVCCVSHGECYYTCEPQTQDPLLRLKANKEITY